MFCSESGFHANHVVGGDKATAGPLSAPDSINGPQVQALPIQSVCPDGRIEAMDFQTAVEAVPEESA